MTQEPGATKTQSSDSTSSVIISTMPPAFDTRTLNETLQRYSDQILELQMQVESLKRPQLMYRPPNSEEYMTIANYLNEVDRRLSVLEERLRNE